MADPRVARALAWLRKHSSRANRDGMARYAIPSDKALGVKMGDIQKLARLLGRDHALALELWETDVYEARMLCAYIDEIEKVTPALMDRQARDFDNWAICDTLCFALWVRSPHAFQKIRLWSGRRGEYVKRAAFALLASVALRGMGRRSPALHKASLALAKKLAAYEEPAPRWIGKDALRELTRIKPKGP
jgi:3-methyladenine DNA glycosylase AlkD